MANLYEKTKKWDRVGVTVFAILFLTVGFLQLSSLTFGRGIISVVQWPTVALGAVLVLERLVFFGHYRASHGIYFWAAFVVSFGLSALLAFRYGFRNNARMFLFLLFQIALLYATDRQEERSVLKKRFTLCSAYFLTVFSLMEVASVWTMLSGFSRTYQQPSTSDVPTYYVGFHFGRLFGVFWDPNIAALGAAVAAVLSLHLLLKRPRLWRKIGYGFLIVLHVVYISLSDSRTGILCLTVGGGMYALIRLCRHAFSGVKWKQAAAVILLASLCACTAFALPKVMRQGCIALAEEIYTRVNRDDGEETTDVRELFDRGYDITGDPSNRRFDIWKGALEIAAREPVFGVSRANILHYVDENLPQSYLVTNDHMRFDSMHNLYLEILVSQGAVGLLLFLAAALSLALPALKHIRALVKGEAGREVALIFGILSATLVSTLVMAEIVYVISPVSTLFWLSCGNLSFLLREEKTKKEEEKTV